MRERFFSWLSHVRIVQYGVSALVFDSEGRVLLVKHRLRGGWEWPAGGGKLGELPERAVVRELEEETGVNISHPKLVVVHARSVPGLATRFNLTFAATVDDDAAAMARHDRLELTDLRWLSLDEAKSCLTPRLQQRFEAAIRAWHEDKVAYLAGH